MRVSLAAWDDIGVQHERAERDDPGRNRVGQHQPPETHPARQHGDHFRIVCQLRGEEDDGDESEQRAEQIGEIGDEVHVIVEDDRFQRHVRAQELVDLLVDVEDDRDGDDQGNRKDISAQELLDDIPVYPFQFEFHVAVRL